MAQKGNLLSVRQDIRVVDATIRDGGLCNDFRLFCNDDDIRAIIGEGSPKMKVAVMADVGRTDFETDIIPKNESPIDLVRIATYINTIPAAVEMIEYCAKQGYETTINIMAVSKARTEDIKTALEILGQTPVSCFYIVDSYGSLYPEEARRLAEMYGEIADKYGKLTGIHAHNKYGKLTGIHAHNNQQLAFANTIDAMAYGASYLDATVNGMGRGAGNCALELLLGFLKNPKYKVNPIIKFVQQNMNKLREEGVKWGYVGLRHSVHAHGSVQHPPASRNPVRQRQPRGLLQVRERPLRHY